MSRSIAALLVLCVSAYTSVANAATITWGAPSAVTADTDVLGASGIYTAFVEAQNLGNGANQTINSVDFTGALGGNTNAGSPFGGFYSGTTGDAGLDNLLTTGAFGVDPVVLTLSDLKVGLQYRLQMFNVDDRSGFVAQMTVDGSTEWNIDAASSLVGTFTADATTQVVSIARSASATGGQAQLNGYSLFAEPVLAPEPSTLVLALLGTFGLGVSRRRRVRS